MTTAESLYTIPSHVAFKRWKTISSSKLSKRLLVKNPSPFSQRLLVSAPTTPSFQLSFEAAENNGTCKTTGAGLCAGFDCIIPSLASVTFSILFSPPHPDSSSRAQTSQPNLQDVVVVFSQHLHLTVPVLAIADADSAPSASFVPPKIRRPPCPPLSYFTKFQQEQSDSEAGLARDLQRVSLGSRDRSRSSSRNSNSRGEIGTPGSDDGDVQQGRWRRKSKNVDSASKESSSKRNSSSSSSSMGRPKTPNLGQRACFTPRSAARPSTPSERHLAEMVDKKFVHAVETEIDSILEEDYDLEEKEDWAGQVDAAASTSCNDTTVQAATPGTEFVSPASLIDTADNGEDEREFYLSFIKKDMLESKKR
mmetsp:Transcript_32648/g.63957  ORF Transcript_32648/g.63957 Transcript_32648/m.63957 type:complete len:365 (+) Transcript_32648:78-1172(+)|eukprot:CAMPEP_0175142562 /NCGR_PEP_ID=MMETSP0087-20121206/12887_1 /TAXON_ID=136419 /ORGANISM="Unknown Unknown, Strain D1" /LENGTH=364 /DNA_ID=CAMNT_0016426417 /DNA_START=29 /DNA_END=1123 /DNA_ORIENTATION=+